MYSLAVVSNDEKSLLCWSLGEHSFFELRENHFSFHCNHLTYWAYSSSIVLLTWHFSALLPLGIGLCLDSRLVDVCLLCFACEPNDALSSGTYWSALRILLNDMMFVTVYHSKRFGLLFVTIWWMCFFMLFKHSSAAFAAIRHMYIVFLKKEKMCLNI